VTQIGFVGLGKMGGNMVRRWMRGGSGWREGRSRNASHCTASRR